MDSTDTPAPKQLIETIEQHFGGVTQLAAQLGVTEGAVRDWKRKDGMPLMAARLTARIAGDNGIVIFERDLLKRPTDGE